MARQTFTKGQVVYTKSYSGWRKVIVADPDVAKRAYSNYGSRREQFVHYVGVQYVNEDGTVGEDT